MCFSEASRRATADPAGRKMLHPLDAARVPHRGLEASRYAAVRRSPARAACGEERPRSVQRWCMDGYPPRLSPPSNGRVMGRGPARWAHCMTSTLRAQRQTPSMQPQREAGTVARQAPTGVSAQTAGTSSVVHIAAAHPRGAQSRSEEHCPDSHAGISVWSVCALTGWRGDAGSEGPPLITGPGVDAHPARPMTTRNIPRF